MDTSLIPIKGINKPMLSVLQSLAIRNVPELLAACKTYNDRLKLAKRLAEKSKDATVAKKGLKSIVLWLKQADLWYVYGMTPDIAYMLVRVGVRNYIDLKQVDIEKIYPVISSFCDTQIDISLPEKEKIANIIKNADIRFSPCIINFDETDFGTEPKHFFRNDAKTGPEMGDMASNFNAIYESLLGLSDIGLDIVLPLPGSIEGKVEHNDKNKTDAKGVYVSLGGILSPGEDITGAQDNSPFAFTDTRGNFKIDMPDKYNFKEKVSITIRQGDSSQIFYINVSEIISAMYEGNEITKLRDEITVLRGGLDNEGNYKIKEIDATTKQQIKVKITRFFEDNNSFAAVLTRSFLLTNEGFVPIPDKGVSTLPSVKLMGNEENKNVVYLNTDTAPAQIRTYSMLQRLTDPLIMQETEKYMDEEGNEIKDYLANKKRYEDKEITIVKEWTTEKERVTLKGAVNIAEFKEMLATNPGSITKMASLGIGYSLNMHQAWVPDGFALGTLLYSLVLAPGEEQRVVVRERTQSYTVEDDAEGMDRISDKYDITQTDDIEAAYDYGVQQQMNANSGYQFKTKTSGWSIGGSVGGGGGGIMGSIGGGYSSSTTKGSGSAHASQSNSHNEAQRAAQGMQHSIKQGAERIANAKRLSVRSATGSESESVATKIIANHNHSHAMTVQYWEVTRRYRIETCIDSIDLILFIPLDIVRFLPFGQPWFKKPNELSAMGQDEFMKRYENLLKHNDILSYSLPYKYRTGLSLLNKFASLPKWELEKNPGTISTKTITLTVTGNFMFFDDLSARLILKNGKGSIAGMVSKYDRLDIIVKRKYVEYTEISDNKFVVKTEVSGNDKEINCETTEELKREIRSNRNKKGEKQFICEFTVPSNIIDDDYDRIEITHDYEESVYKLQFNAASLSESQLSAYLKYLDKMSDFSGDDKYSGDDIKRINHYKEALGFGYGSVPEALINPNVRLSKQTLRSLGAPVIYDVKLEYGKKNEDEGGEDKEKEKGTDQVLLTILSSNTINSRVYISIIDETPTLRFVDLQKIETTLRHVAENTLHYSQEVWASLSANERAILLEQYTIDIDPTNDIDESKSPLFVCKSEYWYNLPDKAKRNYWSKYIIIIDDIIRKDKLDEKEPSNKNNEGSYHIYRISDLTSKQNKEWVKEYEGYLKEKEAAMEPGHANNLPARDNPVRIMPDKGDLGVNTKVPLLNCIDNSRPMGFYGNCMLLPFTFPEELANDLGVTAKELQDRLYNYHTNSFRVPTTTISLPTEGMVGEAVLGETNVSEIIDLTRFWNWKDSDIDHQEISSDYFKNNNLLDGVNTKDLTMPTQGAPAPTAVTVPDLLSAMINKQAPTFNDITGLSQLQSLLDNAVTTNAAGRDNALNKVTEMNNKTLDSLVQTQKAEADAKAAEKKAEVDAKAEEKKALADTITQLVKSGALERDNNGNYKNPELAKLVELGASQLLPSSDSGTSSNDSTSKSSKPNNSSNDDSGDDDDDDPSSGESGGPSSGNNIPLGGSNISDINKNYGILGQNSDGTYIIDYDKGFQFIVPGEIFPIGQPKSMSCWATAITMLFSWKESTKLKIGETVARAGQLPPNPGNPNNDYHINNDDKSTKVPNYTYKDLYDNNTGLPPHAYEQFAKNLGLVGEMLLQTPANANWFIERLETGPLWIDLDPDIRPYVVNNNNGIISSDLNGGGHVVVVYGISGTSSSAITLHIINPWPKNDKLSQTLQNADIQEVSMKDFIDMIAQRFFESYNMYKKECEEYNKINPTTPVVIESFEQVRMDLFGYRNVIRFSE